RNRNIQNHPRFDERRRAFGHPCLYVSRTSLRQGTGRQDRPVFNWRGFVRNGYWMPAIHWKYSGCALRSDRESGSATAQIIEPRVAIALDWRYRDRARKESGETLRFCLGTVVGVEIGSKRDNDDAETSLAPCFQGNSEVKVVRTSKRCSGCN